MGQRPIVRGWGGAGVVGGGAVGDSVVSDIVISTQDAPAGGTVASWADALSMAASGPEAVSRIYAHELDTDLDDALVVTHDGGDGAANLSVSGSGWAVDAYVGWYVWNQTDGSWGKVTANTATTMTATLYGGSARVWDDGDSAAVTPGIEVPDGGSVYDLTGIVLGGTSDNLSTFNFDDGAEFKGARMIGRGATIRSSSSTPCMELSGNPFGDTLIVDSGILVGSHLAPIFHAASGESLVVELRGNTKLGGDYQNKHPVFTAATGGSITIHLYDEARIQEGTLGGDNANLFDVEVRSPNAQCSLVHPGFTTGTLDPTYPVVPVHADSHIAAGDDPLDIANLAASGSADDVPHDDGAGGITMKPVSGDGIDSSAIHDDAAGEINAITEKAAAVSADVVLIEDSAASNAKKKVQAGNLPSKVMGSAKVTEQWTHTSDTDWTDITGGSTGSITLKASTDYKISLSADIATSSGSIVASVRVYDDTRSSEVFVIATDGTATSVQSAFFDIQTPGSGSSTYKLQGKIADGAQTVTVDRAMLLVEEI